MRTVCALFSKKHINIQNNYRKGRAPSKKIPKLKPIDLDGVKIFTNF